MNQNQSGGALAGIRVIDLSRVLAGPYCTQILADHGAHVVKVEPPQGDDTRNWGPPFEGDTASYFNGVNRNKLGISMDFARPEERVRLLGLLETADVLVENFKTGTLERWDLGYEQTLAQRFPRLVHCRISGFGADGPLGGLPGYDAALQAMTGIMSINGEAGGAPLRVGMPIVDMVTGLNAALGIMLALRARDAGGSGQFMEVSLFDCALSILHPHSANYFGSGKVPGRSGNAHPNVTPYDKFQTGTVEIYLAVGNNAQFAALCESIGVLHLATDERFVSNASRGAHRDVLRAVLEDIFRKHDGAALADMLIRKNVPCAPVLTVDTALALPHTAHRQMLVTMGSYRGIASPIKLSRTPASYRAPPPRLNEHAGIVFAANSNEKEG